MLIHYLLALLNSVPIICANSISLQIPGLPGPLLLVRLPVDSLFALRHLTVLATICMVTIIIVPLQQGDFIFIGLQQGLPLHRLAARPLPEQMLIVLLFLITWPIEFSLA